MTHFYATQLSFVCGIVNFIDERQLAIEVIFKKISNLRDPILNARHIRTK